MPCRFWYNVAAMNLPNKLTIARCVLAAVYVVLMSVGHLIAYVVAYVIFIVACVTDYYDGKIARAQNLVTNFGKLVDPVADKVLICSAFIMLMEFDVLRIPGWALILILARDFMVTGARSLAAASGHVLAANIWGKRKTVYQMIYVFTFMFLAMLLHAVDAYPAFAAAVPLDWALAKLWVGRVSLAAMSFVSLYTMYSGVQFLRVNKTALGIDNLT